MLRQSGAQRCWPGEMLAVLVVFGLAGAACAGGGLARAGADGDGGEKGPAGQLQFLEGTWADLGDERQVTAQWVAVHPRLLLGTAMVVRDTLLLGSAHQEIWLDAGRSRLLCQPHDGPAARLVAPLVRWALVRRSPYARRRHTVRIRHSLGRWPEDL